MKCIALCIFSLFLVAETKVLAQAKNCANGVCIYEDSIFKQDKFYQGQAIAFIYYWVNKTDSLRRYRTIFSSNFSRIMPNGSVKPLYEMTLSGAPSGMNRPDTIYTKMRPKSIDDAIFDSYYKSVWNDSLTEYTKKYGEENRLGLIKPGKYFLEKRVIIAPDDKIITLRKEFEILEAKGRLKQEFLDFVRVVNYYYRFEYGEDAFVRMYDPNQRTITWYVNTYPNSIYTAELLRFVGKNWKQTGYRPSFIKEQEAMEHKKWLELFPFINGNFSDLDRHLLNGVTSIDMMHKYGLITDEDAYMDKFLKSIEDKPSILSDKCIAQYIRFHPSASLVNYAKAKQSKID